jgi:hypothetical protein
MATDLLPWGKPVVLDVAAVLRARTKDLTGEELGDFDDNTRPTGTEVARLIDLAYDEVCGYVGLYLADRCAGLARSLVIIRAAWWVEGSYWPEQVRSDRTIYDELATQFTNGLVGLQACAEGNLPGGNGDDDGVGVGLRFGMLNVHGWTSVRQPFGTPDAPGTPSTLDDTMAALEASTPAPKGYDGGVGEKP